MGIKSIDLWSLFVIRERGEELPKKKPEEDLNLDALQDELRQAKAQIQHLDQLSRTLQHQVTNMSAHPAIVLHPTAPIIRHPEHHQQYHLPRYSNPIPYIISQNPSYQNLDIDPRAQNQNTNLSYPVVPTQSYSMEVSENSKNSEFPVLSVDNKETATQTGSEDKPSYAMVARND